MVRIIDKLSLFVASLAIGMNQWMSGLYAGVSYASSRVCDYRYPTLEMGGVQMWISDSDPYLYLGNLAVSVNLALVILIAIKLFENGLLLRLLSIALIGACLFSWFMMNGIIRFEVQRSDKYLDALREAPQFHFTVLGLLVLLLALQLASIGDLLRSGRGTKPVVS